MIRIITSADELRAHTSSLKSNAKTIGFVPTMGALHEGHLTLARSALSHCDECIVSIFVNPKQFAPHEDFDRYPRTLDKDAELLHHVGAQTIFAPAVETMYPTDFQTTVTVGEISKPLEGEFRPHFFSGVATVVARLLLMVRADKAFFGEKDYQQLQVIRALQHDLVIPTEIVGVPVVRDASGLALSSRNAFLSQEQKEQSLALYRTLCTMAERAKTGIAIETIESEAIATLLSNGFDKVDYMAIRDSVTLLPPTSATKNLRFLGAAWMGKTRLIDNIGA